MLDHRLRVVGGGDVGGRPDLREGVQQVGAEEGGECLVEGLGFVRVEDACVAAGQDQSRRRPGLPGVGPRTTAIAASTIWEILKNQGIDPSPDRAATAWADFLRSQGRRRTTSSSGRTTTAVAISLRWRWRTCSSMTPGGSSAPCTSERILDKRQLAVLVFLACPHCTRRHGRTRHRNSQSRDEEQNPPQLSGGQLPDSHEVGCSCKYPPPVRVRYMNADSRLLSSPGQARCSRLSRAS